MGKRAPTLSDASPEGVVGQAATSDTAGDPGTIENN
jgi:hypothetical protein